MHARILRLVEVRRSGAWSGWRELSRAAPPFMAPEFFALTAPLADGEALVAIASRAGRVVGALPLLRSGDRLQRLGTPHTPNFDYCGTPDGLEAIWRALWRDGGWSELFLDEVPAESPLATRLPGLAGADRCPAVVRSGERNPYLVLPGFEARLASRFRMGLRRCERKAGGLELELIARPTRADFHEATAIEAMAWKGAAGSSIAAHPRVAHLYAALGRLLGRHGRAHVCFLRAGGRRIATALTARDSGTLYVLKVGYDPQYAVLGPGHLLVWKLAAEAEARGLTELNFLGHESEWKRKWTDRAHDLVAVRVYNRSVRGLVRYGLREVVKPRLPERMQDLRAPLRHGCQRLDIIGVHTLKSKIRGPLEHGLEVGVRLWRDLQRRRPQGGPLGAPSRFAPGDTVRVLDAALIRATLDAASCTRGLKFMKEQFPLCGRVYRVQKQVRRLRDDHGKVRPVARTVLLEGSTCAGEGPSPQGCGRHCPTMWRDEWLEPAPRPSSLPAERPGTGHARVRKLADIVKSLDLRGRRDGLTFTPEMAECVGRRFRIVERIPKVKEWDRWVGTRGPTYILEGLHCSGSALDRQAPCDRACALLWHEDWLLVEARSCSPGSTSPPPPPGSS